MPGGIDPARPQPSYQSNLGRMQGTPDDAAPPPPAQSDAAQHGQQNVQSGSARARLTATMADAAQQQATAKLNERYMDSILELKATKLSDNDRTRTRQITALRHLLANKGVTTPEQLRALALTAHLLDAVRHAAVVPVNGLIYGIGGKIGAELTNLLPAGWEKAVFVLGPAIAAMTGTAAGIATRPLGPKFNEGASYKRTPQYLGADTNSPEFKQITGPEYWQTPFFVANSIINIFLGKGSNASFGERELALALGCTLTGLHSEYAKLKDKTSDLGITVEDWLDPTDLDKTGKQIDALMAGISGGFKDIGSDAIQSLKNVPSAVLAAIKSPQTPGTALALSHLLPVQIATGVAKLFAGEDLSKVLTDLSSLTSELLVIAFFNMRHFFAAKVQEIFPNLFPKSHDLVVAEAFPKKRDTQPLPTRSSDGPPAGLALPAALAALPPQVPSPARLATPQALLQMQRPPAAGDQSAATRSVRPRAGQADRQPPAGDRDGTTG